jgi:hypothetical protein
MMAEPIASEIRGTVHLTLALETSPIPVGFVGEARAAASWIYSDDAVAIDRTGCLVARPPPP